MRNLVLIRGVSGSGKSTVSNLFRAAFSVATDDMFMIDGKYEFDKIMKEDPSMLRKNHELTVDKVKEQMLLTSIGGKWDTKYSLIVVHNTFTKDWEMKAYFELAKEFDWMVHTIIVENRHNSDNTHGVPQKKVNEQRERFEIVL